MPKASSPRSFTACWTCRRRGVRCDTAQPDCSQCIRSRLRCEGYHVRLAWVDSDTGTYIEGQRRAYPPDLTWKGYPTWTLKEIDHLIRESGRECQCNLHHILSPFSTLLQTDDEPGAFRAPETIIEPEPGNGQSQFDLSSPIFTKTDTGDLISLTGTGPSPASSPCPRLDEGTHFDIDDRTPWTDLSRSPVSSSSPEFGEGHDIDLDECPNSPQHIIRLRVDRKPFVIPDPLPRSLSLMPGVSVEETQLFRHFICHVSDTMVPINDGGNPWKSIYPSLAVHDVSSSSTRSLYHAILACSATHQANLKGAGRGEHDGITAMRHYGKAIRHLCASLEHPAENYSSVLAALMSVSYAENFMQRASRGYRSHFRGAVGYVTQYINHRPWILSLDARTVTYNFAIYVIIAQTTSNGTASFTDNITGLLYEVMSQPGFGHTIGGNARLIKAIYQTRLLEEHIAAAGHTSGSQGLSEGIQTRVRDIARELQVPLVDEEVELYMETQESTDLGKLHQKRTLVKLHLHLFNAAVRIYLFCVVLKCPPSAVAEYSLQVLTDAITFVDMGGVGVSIWPVFIAAAEAYTPETQMLASCLLQYSETLGAGNRQDSHSVVRQVWADRRRLAEERQCDPGEVFVEWRDVMKRMDLDLLLL